MSLEENKAAVRRYIDELQTKHNLEAVYEFLDPSYVNHVAPPGQDPGRDGSRQFLGMMAAAFPDLHTEIHSQIAEGDDVVTHKTMRGTHKGEFMGVPPTGKQIELKVIDILRFSNGKITAHWAVADRTSMLETLGLITRKA